MDEAGEAQFIKMPDAFKVDILNVLGMARQIASIKVKTAKDLRDDIPADWEYNPQLGGFVPPRKRPAPPPVEEPTP